jgi:heme-degrading monooxygenase HmoA
MTSISEGAPVVTLINVFTVAPERQQQLVELLERATREVIRHQPGFVSANLHVGREGDRVANYAQWASEEDYRRMLADPGCREHLTAAAALAEVAPALYTVASVHMRPGV